MRVSSAPVTGPCYYGIDTPSREELIAANNTHRRDRRAPRCRFARLPVARRNAGVRARWTQTAFVMPVSPATIRRRPRPIPTSCVSAVGAELTSRAELDIRTRPRAPARRDLRSRASLSAPASASTTSTAAEPKSVYFFGDGKAEGTQRHEGRPRRQGREPRRDDEPRRAGAAGVHDRVRRCASTICSDGTVPDALRAEVDAALEASRAGHRQELRRRRRIRCSSRCDRARRCRCPA